MSLYEKPEQVEGENPFNIKSSRVATNSTVRPVPVLWGTHRRGITFLDEIFNYRTETITEKVKTGKNSSSDIVKAINYFGSIAGVFCFGPLHRVLAIYKDDVKSWEGNLVVDGDAYFSISFDASNNPMILYTGLQDSGTVRGGGITDENLPVGHPPYKNFCWFIMDEILFGTTPNPPNYEVAFEVVHRSLVLDPFNLSGDPELEDIDLHRVDDGQLVPEIIHSVLTNPLFGLGLDNSLFDLDSWVSACNRLREEGLGYSAKLDEKTSIESFIKKLLNFVDGEIDNTGGTLKFKLRRSDDPVISIPESAFLKKPEVQPGSWYDSDIVNEVKVSFSSLDRDLEPLPLSYTDDASRSFVGVRSKTFSFEGIRSEQTAALVASRIVRSLGFPSVRYKFELDRTQRNLETGDLISPIFPDYDLDGSTTLRILSLSFSAPGKGGMTVEAEVDKSYLNGLESGSFDPDNSPADPVPNQIFGHICSLTPELRGQSLDGFILGLCRESASDDRVLLRMGWDSTNYEPILASSVFQLKLVISEWRDFGDGNFQLTFKFLNDHEERTFLDSVSDDLPDWHLLTTLDGAADSPSLSVIRAGTSVQDNGGMEYILNFTSGVQGTPLLSLDGFSPGQIAYLGPLSSFVVYRSDQKKIFLPEGNDASDSLKIRFFQLQSSTRGFVQDINDVYEFYYDQPNNLLSPNWGGAASHAFGFGVAEITTSGLSPLTVELELTGTENFDYSIDWNDGSGLDTATNQTPMVSINHVYSSVGSYTATVMITPTAGGATQSFEVEVTVT